MEHVKQPCRQAGGINLQYSNKNYSDLFVCIECGKSRRFSLNFLGGRRVPMCDGVNIKGGDKLDYQAYRAMKDKANGVTT